MQRPAIPDILEECLEELAFLAARLRALRFSPEVPERRLAEHEARGAGWRDCLAQHPDESAGMAERWLESPRQPWLLASAISLWLDLRKPDGLALAVRVQNESPDRLADWRQALRSRTVDPSWQQEAARSERPAAYRHLLLDALGWHGAIPARLFEQAAADLDPLIRWSIARHAARHQGGVGLSRALCADVDARVAAVARYNFCLGDPKAGLSRAGQLVDDLDLRLHGLFADDASVGRLEAAAVTRPQAATTALVDLGTRNACAALLRLGSAGLPGLSDMLPGRKPSLEAWDEAAGGATAVLYGKPWPWTGLPGDVPMLQLWRNALRPGGDGPRRDIIDGVIAGEAGIMEPGV